ncbi:MAG: MGMT family protein [Planctomycetaceae bacterium]|nr:MGMT family protein [Planctomycetaceae bacterium]
MGFVEQANCVERLIFGHSSAAAVWNALSDQLTEEFEEAGGHSNLREMLEKYAAGEFVDFSDVEVNLSHLTEFQARVIAELRKVGYGETLSYAELATRAGSPKAARAVGSVMSQNRIPLIIPCHRVVGTSGHLGGFSAPRGIALKKELLEMEAQISAVV